MREHLDALSLEIAAIGELISRTQTEHAREHEGHRLPYLGDVAVRLQEMRGHLDAIRKGMR